MHHKRRCTKNQRAGCLMCKPNKMVGYPAGRELGHYGFGKIRAEAHARADLRDLR